MARSSIPWLRVFVEGLVIVISILLAFGIDAWWDSRQESQEELSLLRALRSDFERTETELEIAARMNEAAMTATDSLLALLAGRAGTVDVPVDLVVDMLRPATPDPPTGALEALLASGRLSLIRDGALQGALADWPAALDDLKSKADEAEAFVHGEVLPVLGSHLDVAPVIDGRLRQVLIPPGSRDPVLDDLGQMAFPATREVVSLLQTRRLMTARLMGNNWIRLHDTLNRIMTSLETDELVGNDG